MERLALLLGNTNGLPGIQKDIKDFEHFLHSNIGGAWNKDEIIKENDISLSKLHTYLKDIKVANFDYFILYFTGHGGYKRGTVFELNRKKECISEDELDNLAMRQLNIFDCCRQSPTINEEIAKSAESLAQQFSTGTWRKRSRELYNGYILKLPPQQISLYACSIEECANATSSGSVYTQQLLKAAKQVGNTADKLVLDAHKVAWQPTVDISTDLEEVQHPDYKVLTLGGKELLPNEQLIISVRSFHLRG